MRASNGCRSSCGDAGTHRKRGRELSALLTAPVCFFRRLLGGWVRLAAFRLNEARPADNLRSAARRQDADGAPRCATALQTISAPSSLQSPCKTCRRRPGHPRCPSQRHTPRCARRGAARQRRDAVTCAPRRQGLLTRQPAERCRPRAPRRSSWRLSCHLNRARRVSPGARRALVPAKAEACAARRAAAAAARTTNAPAMLLFGESAAQGGGAGWRHA